MGSQGTFVSVASADVVEERRVTDGRRDKEGMVSERNNEKKEGWGAGREKNSCRMKVDDTGDKEENI